MVPRDDRTGERILYEFARPSLARRPHRRAAGGGPPLIPGWYAGPGWPLGGCLVTALLIPAFAVLSMRARSAVDQTASFVGFLALVLLVTVLEDRGWRSYVTPTRVVLRWGVLWRRRREVPLESIEHVAVETSAYWPATGVGDLVLDCPGDRVTIAYVLEPEDAARALREIRDRRGAAPVPPHRRP